MHLAIWIVLGQAILGASAEPSRNYPFDCGVYSLLILGELEGRHLNVPALFDALPARDPRGFSMAELIAASDRIGLPLEGIRLAGEDLSIREPALFIWRASRTGISRPPPGGGHGQDGPGDRPALSAEGPRLQATPVLARLDRPRPVRREPWWARHRLTLALAGIAALLFFGLRASRRSPLGGRRMAVPAA